MPSRKKHSHSYDADIIVIGGGAAGCILMNSLSKHFSVIGLEAGQNLTNDPAIQAVGLPAFLLPSTAPQKFFWPGWKQSSPMFGLNGRVSDWTTGIQNFLCEF
jgi:choline dehydrogenase-like flavoprotein